MWSHANVESGDPDAPAPSRRSPGPWRRGVGTYVPKRGKIVMEQIASRMNGTTVELFVRRRSLSRATRALKEWELRLGRRLRIWLEVGWPLFALRLSPGGAMAFRIKDLS